MSELTVALERLVAGWKHAGRDVGVLSPGLPADEVRERVFTATGLTANDEIVEWFGFANGTREGLPWADRLWVVPSMRVSPLEIVPGLSALLAGAEIDQLESLQWNNDQVVRINDPRFTDHLDTSFLGFIGMEGGYVGMRLRDGMPGVPIGHVIATSPAESMVTMKWPSLASVVNEAAWWHLTDQVDYSLGYFPNYEAIPLLDPAPEQTVMRPLPQVAEFFGDKSNP